MTPEVALHPPHVFVHVQPSPHKVNLKKGKRYSEIKKKEEL